jgi:hypothetical protein
VCTKSREKSKSCLVKNAAFMEGQLLCMEDRFFYRRYHMIEYLKADNYKSLVNFKIDFSKINILLGSNGSGKSTIFFLIYSLRAFIRGDKKLENLFDFSTLTRWK